MISEICWETNKIWSRSLTWIEHLTYPHQVCENNIIGTHSKLMHVLDIT